MAYPVSRRLTRHSGRYGARKPIRLPDGTLTPSWHGGEDFTPLVPGTRLPVYAVGAGTVVIADRTTSPSDFSGMDVGIRLADRSIWWYGHLSRVDVNVGQRVSDGQQIGLMGATGRVTGVHLHLERHWPTLNVETDPWPYIEHARDIDGNTSSWQTGNPDVAIGDAGITKGFLMALTDTEQAELLATTRAIRSSQITPQGYTYDAAILGLLQKLVPAVGDITLDLDQDALAAAVAASIPDGLAEKVADELHRRLAG